MARSENHGRGGGPAITPRSSTAFDEVDGAWETGCDDPLPSSDPPHAHPLIGRILGGSYRILGLIDRGGMGAVLEAAHLRLDRTVAVKVLAEGFRNDPIQLRRFYQEAVFVSQLRHPHIVQVIDFDVTEEGVPYLVMERLVGETLERRLARERTLSLGEALDFVRQIAAPLAAAHAAGVIHRDLKPGNVFLERIAGEADFVKLLDFGISKRVAGARRITGEHELLGTPAYMAPEQIAEHLGEVDARSDQYALAVVLWEMLTGTKPFGGTTPGEALDAVVEERTPLLSARTGNTFPVALEAALRRAMSKRPVARFSSVPAFVRALEDATLTTLRDARLAPAPVSVRPAGAGTTQVDDVLGDTTSTEDLLIARLGGPDRKLHRAGPPSVGDRFMCPVLAFLASRLDDDLTVGDVLDMSPFDELETLQALESLAREGIVQAV
jgi:serine/threonine protein kinase